MSYIFAVRHAVEIVTIQKAKLHLPHNDRIRHSMINLAADVKSSNRQLMSSAQRE